MGKPKVECKKLDTLTDTQKCAFCQKRDIDETKFGPIYTYKNIITHYYCLLLSSNMEQNGRDSDGILGFLPDDITKEVRRGMRLCCSFCKAGGATLGCSIAKCKVVFHLPCGVKHGTLHQFFGEFKSYCAKHRPVQAISEKILAESGKGAMCGICYEKVVPRPIHETLWAPCCQKNAFFHRECVQRLAISAGYFFKCPLCNNQEKFQKEMKNYGIYIPEQDASWECVPQAYQDLLVRHDTCDSAKCICPSGRKTSVQGTRWELILCKFCGSQGIHIGCGRLKWKCPEFECDICANSNAETQDRNSRNYNGNRHRLSGSNRTAADTHPSVSADREREESANSSDDSGNVTLSNLRKKVVSPRSERHEARHRSPETASHNKTDLETRERSKKVRSILIEDSDDDIELVSESKLGDCLKTKDGSMIQVVHMNSGSVQKRPRIVGDVTVVPEEIVDITIQMDGPSRKRDEPVTEVLYSLPAPQPPPPPRPQPQPSTSAAYSAPSTSYAPPSDVGQFVLVDPSTLRPEDLPPGTVLLRSIQPMPGLMPQTPTPQIPQPMPQPPQHPTTSTSMQMPQLGDAGHANAKHPDICKYWPRGCYYFNSDSRKKYPKEASRAIKCDSPGRRGRRRGHTRCNHDRLNPIVEVEPLKFRTSNNGHTEIIISRRENLRGYLEYRIKRQRTPLPSFCAKKVKLPTKSKTVQNPSNLKHKKKNKCLKVKLFSNSGSKSKKKSIDDTPKNKKKTLSRARQDKSTEIMNSSNTELQENSIKTKKKSSKKSMKVENINNFNSKVKKKDSATPDIALFFTSVSSQYQHQVNKAYNMNTNNIMDLSEKENEKRCSGKRRKQTSESSPEENIHSKKRKNSWLDWKGKKIDFFFKKCNDKSIETTDIKHSLCNTEESLNLETVRVSLDTAGDSVCEADSTQDSVPIENVNSSAQPDIVDGTDAEPVSDLVPVLKVDVENKVRDSSMDTVDHHTGESIQETITQCEDSNNCVINSDSALTKPSSTVSDENQRTSVSSSSSEDNNLTSPSSVDVFVDTDEGNYQSVILKSPSSKANKSKCSYGDDKFVNQIHGFFPKIKINSKNKRKICRIKEKDLVKVKDVKSKEVKVRKAKEIVAKKLEKVSTKKSNSHPRESVIKYASISQYFVSVKKEDSDIINKSVIQYPSDDNITNDEENIKGLACEFPDLMENNVVIRNTKTRSPLKRPLVEMQVNNLREIPCAQY